MKTTDLIRNITGFSDRMAATFFEDMRDAPLTRPQAAVRPVVAGRVEAVMMR